MDDTVIGGWKINTVLMISVLSLVLTASIIILSDSDESDAWVYNGFTYNEMPSSQAYINDYDGPGGIVTVPSKIGEYQIVSISPNTFNGRHDLTEIIFEEGTRSIHPGAINNCSGIQRITVSDNAVLVGNPFFPARLFYDENGQQIDLDQVPGYTYELSNKGGATNCMFRILDSYTVSFDPKGGSVTPDSTDVKEKSSFILPAYDGTNEGKTFKGWSYDNKTYASGESFIMPHGDVKFTAVWETEPHNSGLTYAVIGVVALLLLIGVAMVLRK